MTDGPDDAARCAVASRRRGDTLIGTAAPALAWLLIEQPGAWGRDALLESRLDAAVGAAIARRLVAASGRALLIRRPGRSGNDRRRWFWVDSRPGLESIRTGEFDVDEDLLEVGPAAGRPYHGPLWLVCTHGRHDRCCAQDGRPVAAALAERVPGRTWECSHVGGDRFAGNVVHLPSGTYLGRVTPADVGDLVAAADAGEIVPRLFRGRSIHTPAQQAAQQLARAAAGSRAAGAYAPGPARQVGHGRYEVELTGPDGHLMATVRSVAPPVAGLLTCAATTAVHPPDWVLESLRPLGIVGTHR